MIYFKRIILNVILGAAVISLSAIISFWFAADYFLISAEKAESRYLWQLAERKYEMATRLDPFDAEYLARYGRFLYRISSLQKDASGYLKRAENLYQRAVELNPYNAYYHLGLGLVYLKEGKEAFTELKEAIRNDPKSFDINYTVGYAGITLWKQLKPDDRALVLESLKYSLKVNPWYAEYIYPQLWQAARDPGLLRELKPEESAQDKKKKLEKIKEIKKELGNRLKLMEIDGNSLSQSDWEGRAHNGKDIYKDGNMYWSGTLNKLIIIPRGKSIISIQAKGSSANGIWPYMIVELDGEEIGETFVETSEWKEYEFKIDNIGTVPLGIQDSSPAGTVPVFNRTVPDVKLLSVTFANDGGNKIRNEDRNLHIGDVRVEISSRLNHE